MGDKILQWNVRGFQANREELLLLTRLYQPCVLALQETLQSDCSKMSLSGYCVLHKSSGRDSTSGGVALLINQNVLCSSIELHTDLQAVAARISFGKTVTVCNIYLPPSVPVRGADLYHLFEQLPRPFIVVGDLNGHNPLWGSDHCDSRGRLFEEVFNDLNLCILNDGSPTYCHPASGSKSMLDLSVADPSLFLDLTWTVVDDLHGSDHFPVLVQFSQVEKAPDVGRWDFRNVNWDLYSDLCASAITEEAVFSREDPALQFTHLLTSTASKIIPKTQCKPRLPKVPWFTDKCKLAIKERKKAQRLVFRQPTSENILKYKQLRAKARYTIKNAKRNCWRQFCSNLNSKTSCKTVWKAIRRLKGKNSSSSIGHLLVDDHLITDKQSVANSLARCLAETSSSSRYSSQFQKFKRTTESKPLKFQSNNTENYNLPFSMWELKQALQKSNNSAAGPDEVHYNLLTHLPESVLSVVLKVYNSIWESETFPPSWREAVVVPIAKAGKDPKNPTNYRPIALTSCLCKTMERMVNARLMWCLESEGHLSDVQCGFRKNRSTVDHLVRFESFVREAFIKKEHVVAIFFDLEKAYDTTWKHGILRDLHELGFRGRLPCFISNFLSDRLFQVKIGSTLSDFHVQENGVPQGSILSPVLFNIKINDIVTAVLKDCESSLFVDDFALCLRGRSLPSVIRRLQLCVNSVNKWVQENGFRFSVSKTECVHFTKQRGIFMEPDIKVDGTSIKVADEAKFLGLVFDRRLTFRAHVKYLKTVCDKALNVLRVVGHTDWGADKIVLLRLYRALVRSKLDYGCIVYGSASKSVLRTLDAVHHAGLRICLGAFRTSPVQSLYVKAGETSLSLRRLRLSMNYVLKLHSIPENPAYDCVINPKFLSHFEAQPHITPTLGIRLQPHFQAAGIDVEGISTDSLLTDVCPWSMPVPVVRFDLTKFKKAETNPEQYKQLFLELSSSYPNHSKIFTDGSKCNEKVAAAAAADSNFKSPSLCRLPDNCSIYTAELHAIHLALRLICQSKKKSFLVLSDSLSVLKSISNAKCDHPLLVDLFNLYFKLCDNKDIVFAWVPGHVGIRGNNVVDLAAKHALEKSINRRMAVPYSDCKVLTNVYVKKLWQTEWESYPENKLYKIQPKVDDPIPSHGRCRREETVLCRLHIGHTFLTHFYLLKGEEPPVCIPCDRLCSIEHLLTGCVDLMDWRRQFFKTESLSVLFRECSPNSIIQFLKCTNLLNKL